MGKKVKYLGSFLKNTTKWKMSVPVCGPSACDFVANYILRIAQVLSKAKLNKDINLVLLFDICTVIFVCFLLSLLLCALATTDSLSHA